MLDISFVYIHEYSIKYGEPLEDVIELNAQATSSNNLRRTVCEYCRLVFTYNLSCIKYGEPLEDAIEVNAQATSSNNLRRTVRA
jgi:hypothetical protein